MKKTDDSEMSKARRERHRLRREQVDTLPPQNRIAWVKLQADLQRDAGNFAGRQLKVLEEMYDKPSGDMEVNAPSSPRQSFGEEPDSLFVARPRMKVPGPELPKRIGPRRAGEVPTRSATDVPHMVWLNTDWSCPNCQYKVFASKARCWSCGYIDMERDGALRATRKKQDEQRGRPVGELTPSAGPVKPVAAVAKPSAAYVVAADAWQAAKESDGQADETMSLMLQQLAGGFRQMATKPKEEWSETEIASNGEANDLAMMVITLGNSGLSRKVAAIIKTTGVKNYTELLQLQSEKVNAVAVQVGMNLDEKLSFERLTLGPLQAALNRKGGEKSKKVMYYEIEKYLPIDQKFPRGTPGSVSDYAKECAKSNANWWNDYRHHLECHVSYSINGRWHSGSHLIPYDWLRTNSPDEWVDDYHQSSVGHAYSSEAFMDYLGDRFTRSAGANWRLCQRGRGDASKQSVSGFVNDWRNRYKVMCKQDRTEPTSLATAVSDVDTFMAGIGLPKVAKQKVLVEAAEEFMQMEQEARMPDYLVDLVIEKCLSGASFVASASVLPFTEVDVQDCVDAPTLGEMIDKYLSDETTDRVVDNYMNGLDLFNDSPPKGLVGGVVSAGDAAAGGSAGKTSEPGTSGKTPAGGTGGKPGRRWKRAGRHRKDPEEDSGG